MTRATLLTYQHVIDGLQNHCANALAQDERSAFCGSGK